MEGFIDAGFEHLEPLMKLRDWLVEHRNDAKNRMLQRRNGKVQYFKNAQGDDTRVMGPYTLEFREKILDELLRTQKEVGVELITQDEIALIKRVWAEDTVRNVRRAPSLPVI
jgi:DNA sulfur modification protein DndC